MSWDHIFSRVDGAQNSPLGLEREPVAPRCIAMIACFFGSEGHSSVGIDWPRVPKNRNFWGFYTIKVALHPHFVGHPLRIGGQLGGDFLKHQPEYVNDSGS